MGEGREWQRFRGDEGPPVRWKALLVFGSGLGVTQPPGSGWCAQQKVAEPRNCQHALGRC